LKLQALGDNDRGCTIGQSADLLNWLISPAIAQSPQSVRIEDFAVRLKSDDLTTRRNARIDLSKEGPQTIDSGRQFLNSDVYRLQLGALVALSLMTEADLKKLPPDVIAKVNEFTSNADPTIRETAVRIQGRAKSP